MIAINCTHCQQRLEMDEAFAGGVCRCQYCGTIQTVPSHLKKAASAATPAAPTEPRRSPPVQGSGLDELADVVASSGLARSGLTKKKGRLPQRKPAGVATAPSPAAVDDATSGEPRQQKSLLIPLLAGAGLVVLALLGVISYLLLARAPASSQAVNGGSSRQGTVAPDGTGKSNASPTEASFAGVPLTSRSVVYLIDRSQANADVLDKLKASVYWSARSLGPQRRFQILFWSHPDEDIVAYPNDGFAPATAAEITAASRQFEDVVGYGNTDLKPALEKAVAANPDAIVIATAKGLYLEEDTLKTVETVLSGKAIKVHTFSVGETESPVLKRIAEMTGGAYRELPQDQFQKLDDWVPDS